MERKEGRKKKDRKERRKEKERVKTWGKGSGEKGGNFVSWPDW